MAGRRPAEDGGHLVGGDRLAAIRTPPQRIVRVGRQRPRPDRRASRDATTASACTRRARPSSPPTRPTSTRACRRSPSTRTAPGACTTSRPGRPPTPFLDGFTRGPGVAGRGSHAAWTSSCPRASRCRSARAAGARSTSCTTCRREDQVVDLGAIRLKDVERRADADRAGRRWRRSRRSCSNECRGRSRRQVRPSAAGPVRGVSFCARVTFACPPCAQKESTSATRSLRIGRSRLRSGDQRPR